MFEQDFFPGLRVGQRLAQLQRDEVPERELDFWADLLDGYSRMCEGEFDYHAERDIGCFMMWPGSLGWEKQRWKIDCGLIPNGYTHSP